METQTKPNRGRKKKYDFTDLQNAGDTIEFEPEGRSFHKRAVRNITSALGQYRRSYAPKHMFITRAVYDDNRITKVIVMCIKVG